MESWKDIQYLYDCPDGIEVFFVTESKLKYPPHSHTSHLVIGMVTEGSVTLYQNKTAHVYHKGQCFFVFPYEEHWIEPIGCYSMVCICVRQDVESGYKAEELACVTAKTLACLKEKFPDMPAVNPSSVLTSLEKRMTASAPKKSVDNPILTHVMKQIEANPEADQSVDALAHTAFMNKYYFIRRFRQLSGLSPHRFQIQCRLRKAQRQFVELGDRATITAIALNAGFCDQSHFTKQFKKYVGINPNCYLSHCDDVDFLHK